MAQQDYILLEPSVSNLPVKLGASSNGKISIGNSIGDVTSFVFILLVTASLVGAVFMIMAGSFTRMTTDSIYKKTEGSEKIRRAIYGLLAVLTMYLIILIINPDMLRKGLDLPSYQTTTPTTPSIQINSTTIPNNPVTVIGDTTNRLTLKNAKIDINKDNCTQAQWGETKPSCTSLEELPQDTINMLVSLKSDCDKLGGSNCSITVTGGTEPGHKTHGKGLYPVDLSCSTNGTPCSTSDSVLNTFISTKLNKNNLSVGQIVNIGGQSVSYCNNIYGPYYNNFFFCDENVLTTGSGAPHWHIIHN